MDRPRDVLQGQFQLETEKRHEYRDVKEIMDGRSQTLCIDGESATAFVRWAQKASKSGKSDGSEVVRKEMIKDMLISVMLKKTAFLQNNAPGEPCDMPPHDRCML